MAYGVSAVSADASVSSLRCSSKVTLAVALAFGLAVPSIAYSEQRGIAMTTLQDLGAKFFECSREQQERLIDQEVEKQLVNLGGRSLFAPLDKKRMKSARKVWRAFLRKRWEIHEFDLPAMPLGEFMVKFGEQTNLVSCYSPGFDDTVVVGPLQGRFLSGDAASIVQSWAGTFPAMGLDGTIQFITKTKFSRVEDIRFNPNAHLMCDPPPVATQHRPVRRGCPSAFEFITVEASRLSDSIATLIGNDPTVTSIVIPQYEIESSGASTLAEVFRRMPQIPFMRGPQARVAGEQYVDLRGFGAGTTMVLVNGRRVGPTATSFDTSAFDLNTVPLAAIKQIDILPDSHLAIGADAIGGIVNIALKDDIPEPVIELRYGAADDGAEERRASLGLGMSRERLRGTVILDAFQREFLLGAERDLTRDQDFRRFGRSDMRSADAMPANISSLTGANLPGLTSSFAAVPAGTESTATIADFEATAGQRNLISPNQFLSIVPATERISAVGTAEFRLSEDVSLFGEVLTVDRENRLQIGPPAVRGAVIPATNPFNPFGEAVIVNALVDGMGATTWVTETSLLRVVLGATATFDEWAAQVSATWHDEDANLFQENHLDGAKVMQALSSTEADRTLNFFRDGPPGSQELLRSLRADRGNDRFDSQYLNGHFSTHGPVFNVSAGEVRLMFGGEWRREELSTPALTARQQVASAVFGELRLPLVAPEMEIAAAEAIDLSIGVRRDSGDFGNESAHYALSWRPTSQMKVIVSYRDFFRAPTLNDLHLARITGGPFRLPDPRRNYELATYIPTIAGNPLLKPSAGRAWTVRLEYEPSEQIELSASYWNSAIENRIAYLLIPFVLNNEARFPDRVIRADPTPQDLELGLPGRLISVDVSPGNFGGLKADGMDFTLKSSWATRIGRLSPTLTATWNHSFTTAISGLQPQQRVGIASDEGTITRWRALASVDLERGNWSLFAALRFTSSYDDAFLGAKNGRSVGTSLQLDAQASMQLDALTSRAALEGTKLIAGAMNLFDAEPEYSEVFGHDGYDRTQADLRQRFWYVGIEKTF